MMMMMMVNNLKSKKVVCVVLVLSVMVSCAQSWVWPLPGKEYKDCAIRCTTTVRGACPYLCDHWPTAIMTTGKLACRASCSEMAGKYCNMHCASLAGLPIPPAGGRDDEFPISPSPSPSPST